MSCVKGGICEYGGCSDCRGSKVSTSQNYAPKLPSEAPKMLARIKALEEHPKIQKILQAEKKKNDAIQKKIDTRERKVLALKEEIQFLKSKLK